MADQRVNLAEVVTFADGNCKICRGQGHVLPGKDVPDRGPGRQSPIACRCAMQAFLAKHRHDIDFIGGFNVWLLGRRPESLMRLAS